MLKVLSFLCLFFIVILSNAQHLNTKNKKAADLFNKASGFYGSDKYLLALKALEQAIKKDDEFIEAYLLMADVYHQTEQYTQEKQSLLTALAIDSTFFTTTYFNIGVASFNMQQFDEAVIWFQKYFEKTNSPMSKEKVVAWIEKTKFVKEAMQKPKRIEPINLGMNINSHYDEYWPSLTADGKTIVFTVLMPKDSVMLTQVALPKTGQFFQEDFYGSLLDDNKDWKPRVRLLPPLNTVSNEGAQTLSADGKWMFFTACGRSDTKGSCDIYFSQQTNFGWSEPINVGAPVNTPYWESQPSFSADGRTLYFTSNRAGGIGGKDIWRATILGIREDGSPFFGKPVNLGPNINTAADENSPFIHQDNRTLYFSSEGWPGLGKMDLFISRMNDDKLFSKAVNLGYPINTSDDEIGLIVTADGQKAYYSSGRFDTSLGGKDLYSFLLPEDIQPTPVSYVRGIVMDEKSRERLQANFELKDLKTGNMIVEALSTNYSGEFLVCLPVGADYALNVSKLGYLFYSDHFNMKEATSATNPFELNIYLKKLNIGEAIVLKNVFYKTNSYELERESFIELDKLVTFLSDNEEVKLQISGHTDNVGGEEYNLNLSTLRAKEVFNYLVSKGINSLRLTYKGFGMSMPITDNDTEAGRAQNRRTEVEIME